MDPIVDERRTLPPPLLDAPLLELARRSCCFSSSESGCSSTHSSSSSSVTHPGALPSRDLVGVLVSLVSSPGEDECCVTLKGELNAGRRGEEGGEGPSDDSEEKDESGES